MAGKKRIDTVAAELVTTKANSIPTCLIMGAGCSLTSGVPLWEEFSQGVLDELEVAHTAEADEALSAIERLEKYLVDEPMNRDLVTRLVDSTLAAASPSRGYSYLAGMVRQGFFSTIITTNWDWLLEDALHRVMRSDQILVLTRDSATDKELAEQIKYAGNRTVVLKLHGDPKTKLRMGELLSTRALDRDLLDALTPRMSKIQIVGHSGQDLDILQLLFQRVRDAEILYVSRRPTRLEEPIKSLCTATVGGDQKLSALRYRPTVRGVVDEPQEDEKINVGEFDHYFCQLALSIERRLLKSRGGRLAEIEAKLLEKEETGLSYINYSQITRMTKAFIGQVTRRGTPDVVFFVNDPSAPGGMELKKRIESDLVSQGIAVGVLHIQGERNNRSFKRRFRGAEDPDIRSIGGIEPTNVKSVHILDSITFSGNTLSIARDQVREWYPNAEVKLGALVVSQLLVDRQDTTDSSDHVYHDTVTDRFEIFFPWGVTQTTADFDRRFPGVDGDRFVHIARRPWGAIEILADEELCSVRLLTIEAGRRLSFQRHLCRDELFVALDDNIGLDICASELKADADAFDPAVKSMVLEKGDYILVSRGVWHRTKASMDRVRLLEVGFGVYDQQYDIERLFDDFERLNADGSK